MLTNFEFRICVIGLALAGVLIGFAFAGVTF